MPRAVAQPIREEIVTRRQTGEPLTAIAQAMAMSYRTVRNLWRRYRERGAEGLAADYERCGVPGPRFPAALHTAALSLKQAHPRWGAGLVKIQLATQFPEQRLPSKRTLQAWFCAAGLQQARTRRPSASPARAQGAHEVWEMDGKEEIRHADGTKSSAISVVDEATGAVLGAALFPPGEVHAGPGGSSSGEPAAIL
jgi:hypothetical protein